MPGCGKFEAIARTTGLAVLSCAIVSCGGETSVEPTAAPNIDGAWTWVQSVSRSTGDTLTPATEGYTAELVLSGGGPETWGQFEFHRDGDLEVTGHYLLGRDQGHGVNYVSWAPAEIPFHAGSQEYVVFVGDSILLMDNPGDWQNLEKYHSTWLRVD